MDAKFEALQQLGAGEFEHLNGSLLKHLEATYSLLKSWNATQALCDAGLYHAAYGTDGFDEKVVSLDRRKEIADIIGKEAEEIVYFYCACDRDYVFPKIGNSEVTHSSGIRFRDRFTAEEFELSKNQAKQFCELTVANELELAIASSAFIDKHGSSLRSLFIRLTPYLSQHAIEANDQVLGPAPEY